MSNWATAFLGLIACATLATAIVQVCVLVAAARVARRLDRLTDRVEQELKPLFGRVDAIGREASRAASLATGQVERVDQVFGDLVQRLDQTLNVLQTVVARPAREGVAMLAALRAATDVLRRLRPRGRSRPEDDDPLFI